MKNEINSMIETYEKDIIKSTQELVRIKSLETEDKEGMPFGKKVNDVLETALNIGEKLGLKTKNVNGYAGHVEIGEGEELFGILCHLDIVPEGSGWTYPPYAAEIHDNRIYGRGTIDNKGPAIAALYALKAVAEADIDLNKRVRLILGTDEESGWEGLKYYFKKEETPDMAFSPDAAYPVIHAEKGILIFKLHKKINNSGTDRLKIKSIEGGNAPNMVPDSCIARLKANDVEVMEQEIKREIDKSELDLTLSRDNEELVIHSRGISAHGSLPEKGLNAISQLLVFLNRFYNNPTGDIGSFINMYNKKIDNEYYGESIGCNFKDQVSGNLIFNVGMIELDQNHVELTINIRYPVTINKEKVLQGIKGELENSGFVLKEGEHKEPLYVPREDPLVQELMKVYRDITGDESKPISIGGGTYARAVEKAVAFGPLFPGQPELAHQKDEYIGIDDLMKNTKIYANTIKALCTEQGHK